MSGYSKWANIKHKKGRADAERGKIFTKIGREIAIAVKEGGSDPAVNGKLRDVLAKAKSNNMPSDNISRSIKKAAGEMDNVIYEEISYEGYAPGGVAVICEVVTENRNRTASDVRHIFDKNGGVLGQTGSVNFMFDHKGVLIVERDPSIVEDDLMMQALDSGAEDMLVYDDSFEIHTAPNDFSAVREALENQGVVFVSAERSKLPQNTVVVDNEETLEKVMKLLDMLNDNDDIMEVYHNAELPDEEDEE
ncbi:MAG: YebC/PmpR family DNA-binding transcriptional regulator [Clostridiales bacterium]|nr:YebC/PmpR family DNA-binding transcriptional regulator [Clostridiales bacterium]